MFAFVRILAMTVSAVLRDRATLIAENILLRQQIAALKPRVKRPHLRPFDRWFLALLTDWFKSLVAAMIVVRPETLIR